MDKKSKIAFILFELLIISMVLFTHYKYFIKKNYVIEGQTDCDPTVSSCFVWECDPMSEYEEDLCTGDPDNDIWYYQVVRRNAGKIPDCDPEEDEECDLWDCDSNLEKDCAQVFCDEETKIEQEAECSDPEQYNLDNLDAEDEYEEGNAEEDIESETEGTSEEGIGEGDFSEEDLLAPDSVETADEAISSEIDLLPVETQDFPADEGGIGAETAPEENESSPIPEE